MCLTLTDGSMCYRCVRIRECVVDCVVVLTNVQQDMLAVCDMLDTLCPDQRDDDRRLVCMCVCVCMYECMYVCVCESIYIVYICSYM